ncbi:MAG: hypothetical protein ACI92E_001085 [Oceanicoccus sp.]|jgi:uncharacterized protein (DUF924 family)
MTATQIQQSDILNYWFGDIGESFDVREQHKVWYGGSAETDEHIRQQFGLRVELAISGQLGSWQNTAMGTLALVLVLDQFTRNIFRGTVQAFAGDYLALRVVKDSVERGVDNQLSIVQKSFFYMPFEHSESLQDQNLSVDLFTNLLDDAPADGKATVESSLKFAQKHRDIIRGFGRFPHRNKILKRQSTAEELAYLAGGGARFGQ